MRRGSRKKQQDQTSRGGGGGGESQQRPVAAATTVATKRQQPPQEAQQQQQRKKYQDEVSSLTTKNYRLAKELVRSASNFFLFIPFVELKIEYLKFVLIVTRFFSNINVNCFNTSYSQHLSFLLIQADLRQRNRDESRNVSRLTMENVSLATRSDRFKP